MSKIDINHINSIIITTYLHEFSSFERKCKEIFRERIVDTDAKDSLHMNIIYTLGILGNKMHLDLDSSVINIPRIKLTDTQSFHDLNLKQMIKIGFKYQIFQEFPVKIESLTNKRMDFITQEVIDKFIKVRNIIAHETDSISIQEHSTIESMSQEQLVSLIPEHLDFLSGEINHIRDDFRNILINYIYLVYLNKQLLEF